MTHSLISELKFFGKREQIGADFSEGKLTNTTGSMLGRVICLRNCWRPFCAHSSNTATRFSRCGVRPGKITRASQHPGPKPTEHGSRSSHLNANRVTTCFI